MISNPINNVKSLTAFLVFVCLFICLSILLNVLMYVISLFLILFFILLTDINALEETSRCIFNLSNIDKYLHNYEGKDFYP